MTHLVTMPAEAFGAWTADAIADYAEDNVATGRWPREGAQERSAAEFASLLPQGIATPGHHLFQIHAEETGPAIGVLWFAIEERSGTRTGFVYDLEIAPAWRRQGHAGRALKAIEAFACAQGLDRIGLHVFAHNPGAQALYESLGYQISSLNMTKALAPPTTAAPRSQ